MSPKNSIIHIWFASRLEPEKGVDVLFWLIQSIQRLPHLRERVSIHICGDGTESEALSSLAEDRRSYPIENISKDQSAGVYYYGRRHQRELSQLYRQIDLTLMPSRFLETFWLSAVESLASGVPVIGFRKGGLISFIPEDLALDSGDPVWSVIRIIERILGGETIRVLDVPSYSRWEWEKRLEILIAPSETILIVHDYQEKIGWAEIYVWDVIESLEKIGKTVDRFSYEWVTTPIKRRVMFISSLFAFSRGKGLAQKLAILKPDVIWMHSVLRYVGLWGILAIVRYKRRYPKVRILLSHHDVGFIAPFPQIIYEESDIPADASLGAFLWKAYSLPRKIVALGKWCYIHINLLFFPKDTEHIVFSPFLTKHIRHHFWGVIVCEFPHSVDTNLFCPWVQK